MKLNSRDKCSLERNNRYSKYCTCNSILQTIEYLYLLNLPSDRRLSSSVGAGICVDGRRLSGYQHGRGQYAARAGHESGDRAHLLEIAENSRPRKVKFG